MHWSVDENGNFYATISFKKAQDTFSRTVGITMACLTLFALSLFVGLLTRIKFRRIKQQNDQFKKIKILTSNFELEVSEDF